MTPQDLEKLKSRVFETENQFQAASNMLISQQFPRLRDKFWHTENEEWKRRIAIQNPDKTWRVETDKEYEERKIREGGQSKSKGLKSGIMDWLIVHNGILYKMELKLPNGRPSENQKELILKFNKDCPNIPVFIAYNLYDVYRFCRWICDTNLTINFPDTFVKFVP